MGLYCSADGDTVDSQAYTHVPGLHAPGPRKREERRLGAECREECSRTLAAFEGSPVEGLGFRIRPLSGLLVLHTAFSY